MTIQINSQVKGINKRYFYKIAKKLLLKEGLTDKFFSVTFTTADFIKKLNSQYRNKKKSTDVLSFEFGEDCVFLGELYISKEDAKKNLQIRKHSLNDELTFLLVHGFTHLLHYDHQTKKQYLQMRAKEIELWNYLHPQKFWAKEFFNLSQVFSIRSFFNWFT